MKGTCVGGLRGVFGALADVPALPVVDGDDEDCPSAASVDMLEIGRAHV